MAKFKSTRCFSAQDARRLYPAGHSHVIFVRDPDDRNGKNAAKAPESVEQTALVR